MEPTGSLILSTVVSLIPLLPSNQLFSTNNLPQLRLAVNLTGPWDHANLLVSRNTLLPKGCTYVSKVSFSREKAG
jgi:hypothetical protein